MNGLSLTRRVYSKSKALAMKMIGQVSFGLSPIQQHRIPD